MLSIVRGRAAAATGNDAVSLYYGGRAERDMIEPAIIAELGGQDGGCRYEAVASEPTSGSWIGATGFVHEHALAQLAASGALADREYYMAGPPPMIDAALRALVIDGGVPVGQVHYDRFY
jgi:toluene monooxygenase electron transfer component